MLLFKNFVYNFIIKIFLKFYKNIVNKNNQLKIEFKFTNDLKNKAESGISTIKDKYARVKPNERPNPGSTRERCDMLTPRNGKADEISQQE